MSESVTGKFKENLRIDKISGSGIYLLIVTINIKVLKIKAKRLSR